jgi:transcriptional regulator with PAS, ATPase and Fis domain
VRFIAATNQDLPVLVQEGRFREDLYYRLKVLEIPIAPLRERVPDIPLTTEHLIGKINRRIGSDIHGVTPESMKQMMIYYWPGNVRELENMIEQAINWSEDTFIDLTGLLAPVEQCRTQAARHDLPVSSFHKSVTQTERDLILSAQIQAGGNKAKAARILSMQRSVLYKKMARLKLAMPQSKCLF